MLLKLATLMLLTLEERLALLISILLTLLALTLTKILKELSINRIVILLPVQDNHLLLGHLEETNQV